MSRLDQLSALGPSLLQLYAGKASQAVISLAVGQPELGPHINIVTTLIDEISSEQARYTPAAGSPQLLDEVAKVFCRMGIETARQNVLVTHGAKLAVDVMTRTLCDIGQEIFWFKPGYTYERSALIDGFKPVAIQTSFGDFSPDLNDLEAKFKNVSGRPVLIINNPVNPTGRVWPKVVLQQIAKLAKKYNAWIISDETYAGLTFEGVKMTPFASLEGMNQRTITICSGSKEMRIPGWRLGYVSAPTEVITAAKYILGDCVGCPHTITQKVALQHLHSRLSYSAEQLGRLEKKRQILETWCKNNGLAFCPMEGAFYCFVDFSTWLQKAKLTNTIEFADKLLEVCGVGIIPGAAFGSLSDTKEFGNWARISYADEATTLTIGLLRIEGLFALIPHLPRQKTSGLFIMLFSEA